MIKIRKSKERGYFDHGWLKTYHTFSFGDYFDEDFMGFSVLRVINEDFVEAGKGFPTHGHRDMEIITYIIDGELSHKDSMGNAAAIKPGEVQRMSAGKGVLHSEFNSAPSLPTHLLQIWIVPDQKNYEPSYEQKNFAGRFGDDLLLVASNEGREGSVSLHQDVDIYVCKAKNDAEKKFPIRKSHSVWLQIVKGKVFVDGVELSDGDGAAISDVSEINLRFEVGSEFLVFDMVG